MCMYIVIYVFNYRLQTFTIHSQIKEQKILVDELSNLRKNRVCMSSHYHIGHATFGVADAVTQL